jgi:hypothetical protein
LRLFEKSKFGLTNRVKAEYLTIWQRELPDYATTNARENTMASKRDARREAESSVYSQLYMAELARASSHIASTLSSTTREAAIAEVVNDFRTRHGPEAFRILVELLARELEKR